MSERSFVCRCEDVTVAEVSRTLAGGLTTIEEIKRYTGLGTGPCQGKECIPVLCRMLVERGVLSAERAQPFTARPPIEAVTFGTLAAAPLAAAPPAEDP